MVRSLALAVLALTLPARAEDLVCWRITADPATISAETAKRRFDTFGSNDWGVAVVAPDGVAEARRAALRVAAQLRIEEAKARLGEMAASDPDWQTKGAAERALSDWDRKRR